MDDKSTPLPIALPHPIATTFVPLSSGHDVSNLPTYSGHVTDPNESNAVQRKDYSDISQGKWNSTILKHFHFVL